MMDTNLAIHELGHALAYAAEGAAVIHISEASDARGYYAQTNAVTIESGGPAHMADSASMISAGAAFSSVLADGFGTMPMATKLSHGAVMFGVCTSDAIGICPDDLESFQSLELGEDAPQILHQQMRRWMMVAFMQAEAWRGVASHIENEVELNGHCNLIGGHLRAMLEPCQMADQLAALPGLFGTQESVDRLVADLPSMGAQLAAPDAVAMLSQTGEFV
jgi:hypothetical protein